MQNVELFTPGPEHAVELGRICFDAFRQISEGHGFERDFPDIETSVKVIEFIQSLPGSFQVAARLNGRLVGSNFMILTDAVAGLGPITIEPAFQHRGIGRRLMQAALDYATQHGYGQVRLLQDSYNTASLSLYASLGFDVREPIGIMTAGPATTLNPSIRRATPGDLPVLAELGRRIYRVSRRNELAAWLDRDFVVLVHEGQRHIRGYLVPGKLGHAVAENQAVTLDLISQVSRYAPPGGNSFYFPLRNTSLYRAILKLGCRLTKTMTLMTLGPYEEPSAPWLPSVAY